MPKDRYWCRDQPRTMLEHTSSLLIAPFLKLTDAALSLYVHPTYETARGRFIWSKLLGPPLLLMALALLPLAVAGFLLRASVSLWYPDRLPYRYLRIANHSASHNNKADNEKDPRGQTSKERPASCSVGGDADAGQQRKDHLVFMTANILLCYDFIVKFNNGIPVKERLPVVARCLTQHNPRLNLAPNLRESVARLTTKETVVVSQLPAVDVLLLQEVMSAAVGYQLAHQLSSTYSDFLYDVAENSFAANLWCAGSGLFLASKLRILCASFRPFTRTTGVGRIAGYGALFAKLDASHLKPSGVVYVTNVHNQAYDETLLYHAASEAQTWTSEFIRDTKEPSETVLCTIFGGDFNGDNISPADRPLQEHPVWGEYKDACREGPGTDQPWAVGTEMRQKKMYFSQTRDPEAFSNVLRDDVQRRFFVIDADVKAHTYDLMSCEPAPDADGEVRAKPYGGLRRIDRLLLHTPKTSANSACSEVNLKCQRSVDNPSTSKTDRFLGSIAPEDGNGKTGVRRRSVLDTKGYQSLEPVEPVPSKILYDTKVKEQGKNKVLYEGNSVTLTGFEKLYGKNYSELQEFDLPIIESVWFPTVLSSLTDHIPYVMQVKVCP